MKCCPKDEIIKKEWIDRLESESKNVPDEKILEICDFSKVLSHPLRVRIAILLNTGDHCVCELVSILKEDQNLVSHHLSIMKKYGFIRSYNKSKYKYYMIEPEVTGVLDILFNNERMQRIHGLKGQCPVP